MNSKKWFIGWIIIVGITLIIMVICVISIDPFFHYHKPKIDEYFYELNNQRSQNDGIIKHFNYDAIITGSSLTENFKTSELDELFGTNSIKVCYSGGSYKEINDNIKLALETNKNIKMVVRGLDKSMLGDDPQRIRTDLGEYPTYLYDDNPFNDVKYLFNKDVLFNRVIPMVINRITQEKNPGITSFDDYSRWQEQNTYGVQTVAPNGVKGAEYGFPKYLTDKEKQKVYDNITQNVTSLADEYKDVEFYYFLPPYSIHWYRDLVAYGGIQKQMETEQYAIELMLEHENIKLFGFSDDSSIIGDLNNYKDSEHYASWINSYILRCMKDDTHRITKDNYIEYLLKELMYVVDYDYESLNYQIDYENDDVAAATWNLKTWNLEPIFLLKNNKNIEIVNGEITEEGIKAISNKLQIKMKINNVDKHNYLVINSRSILDNSKVIIESNNKVVEKALNTVNSNDILLLDAIDLNGLKGDISITFDINCNKDDIVISDIILC